MPGLHICNVVVRATDRRGEYVAVANDGASAVVLTNLLLTDYTATQQHVHIYKFPLADTGAALTLGPGRMAFVFSGVGTPALSDQGNLLLFAQRRAPIWNDSGDVAYLRKPDGTFIDSMTVGHPARHPNGH